MCTSTTKASISSQVTVLEHMELSKPISHRVREERGEGGRREGSGGGGGGKGEDDEGKRE